MTSSEPAWTTLSKTYAYKAQTPDETSFRVDEVQFPSGRRGRYVYAEYPFEVCFVLPIDDDGRIVLLKQFRYPVGQELVEIPAGSPEPGESLEDCARRETEEETGFRPNHLEHVLTFYPSPGSSDMKAHIFIGRRLSRGDRRGNDEEVTEPFLVDQAEAVRLLREGHVQNGGAAMALLLLASQSE
jgi:ADP-ribose pyrophosphatase